MEVDMLRKKSVLISLAITYTLLISLTVMAAPPSGAENPYDRIWRAINDLQAQIDAFPATAVPVGTIVMWSGTLSSIPYGWALCDGNQGTPDLRSRFIMSVSENEDPGELGGAVEHSHNSAHHIHSVTESVHNHNVNPSGSTSIISAGSHDHTATVGSPSANIDVVSTLGQTSVATSGHNHSVTISSDGSHTHQINLPSMTTNYAGGGTIQTGSQQAIINTTSHIPPYFTLAFIMKLADSP